MSDHRDTYRRRLIDLQIDELGSELPAFFIVGPRAVGKTSTARRRAATIVRLDVEAEAAAFVADPDAALRGLPEPVLLDEWQLVPAVLAAVKRAVGDGQSAARFFLTGSVQAEMASDLWPGTGRLIPRSMYGMTVREQLGRVDQLSIFDVLAAGGELLPASEAPDLRGYVDLALTSGYPVPALQLTNEATRTAWLESYLRQLLTHDVEQFQVERDPERLRRYFEVCAINSAGAVERATLFNAAGIAKKTGQAYHSLLTSLLVIESVPAYFSNRLSRLRKSPKLYVVDAALIASALRLETSGVLRDGDVLGRIIDTFVVSQLRVEASVARCRPRLYHLRHREGRHEVDLVAELAEGKVIGMEMKADAAPGKDDARHLIWLREEIGDAFVAGVVFHTGPRAYKLDDRIVAAPICSIWAERV